MARPRWLTYQAKDGVVTTYFEEDEPSLAQFMCGVLDWSDTAPEMASQEIRLLDTFLSSHADYEFLEAVMRRAAKGATVRILLADPSGYFAQARSASLASTPEARTRQGLEYLAEAAHNAAGHSGEPRLQELDLDELLATVRSEVTEWDVAVKFYNEFPSGPLYFARDLVLVGRYTAGRSAFRAPWFLVVDDPGYQNDLYDKLSSEFETIWNDAEDVLSNVGHDRAQPAVAPGVGDPLEIVRSVCERFHSVARELEPNLTLDDEAAVRRLLAAALRLHFDTVVLEEATPTVAGRGGRVDLVLPDEGIAIEVKYLRRKANQKRIWDELLLARERYQAHQSIAVVVCMIYDPTSVTSNRSRVVSDLENREGLNVRVFFSP